MDDRRHPVSVLLPPALVRLFPDASPRVAMQAGSVREVIGALDARWPGMRDRLCEPRPRIRRSINVFVAGQRAHLDTPLEPGAEVTIVTAIVGG